MSVVAILTGIGCFAGAGLIFRVSRKERINKRLAANLSMTSIGDLQPGLVLTGGEVACEDPIQTPYTQTEAAWYGYAATQQQQSQSSAKLEERTLAKGNRGCPFMLKDSSGEAQVICNGGEVCSYPHYRVLKSESGYSVPVKDRIKKLKQADAEKYPEGERKPFFRKLDVEDEPLDIPPDLVEMEPGSAEARSTHKKYHESWIQAGDNVYVLGTVVQDTEGGGMKIVKAGKQNPLLLSKNKEDLAAETFQSNWLILMGVGIGLAGVAIGLILMGLGIIFR